MRTERSLWRQILVGLFLIYTLVPIYLVVLASVRTKADIFAHPLSIPWPPDWSSYVEAWTTAGFSRFLLNSLRIAVPATIIVVVLASLAGYAFAKLRFPGREWLFRLFLAGLVVPIPAIIVALHRNLVGMGLINTHLGVILPQTAIVMPFAVYMMRSFIQEIPDELIEAAQIDGASSATILTRVVVPLALPALNSLAVVQFMFAWQEYLLPLVVLEQDALKPLTVGMTTFVGRYGVNYSGIAAGAVISFLPILILYLVLHRSFTRGLTVGAR